MATEEGDQTWQEPGPGGELTAQADSAEMTRSLIGALSNMADMCHPSIISKSGLKVAWHHLAVV